MKTLVDVNTLTTKFVQEGVVANPKTVKAAVKLSRVQTYQFSRSFGTEFSNKQKGGMEILICEDSIPAVMKAIKKLQSEGQDVAEMKDLYKRVREVTVTIEKDGEQKVFNSKKAACQFFQTHEGLKGVSTRVGDGKKLRGWTISVERKYHTERNYRYRVFGGEVRI